MNMIFLLLFCAAEALSDPDLVEIPISELEANFRTPKFTSSIFQSQASNVILFKNFPNIFSCPKTFISAQAVEFCKTNEFLNIN